MSKEHLPFTLIQPDLIWEDSRANRQHYERFITEAQKPIGIVVLPEMFTTGFTMNPEPFAETMQGETVQWLLSMTNKHNCIITGSIIIKEGQNFYNRLLWVQPDGNIYHYDKHHLFAYAGEDQSYTAGTNKVVVQVNGWKIGLQVCYDLRFPVWCRNADEAYDVMLVVANWPERRRTAWSTLLQARAIENQAYVIGVNRVGTDGNGLLYSGDSTVIDALGNVLWHHTDVPTVKQISLSKKDLQTIRGQLPFLKDADKFMLL